MKILFVNKYDTTGGAGIVATRLHRALEEEFQTEDRFIVGVKHSEDRNVYCSRRNAAGGVLERGLNYLLNRLGIQYCWLPISTPEIRKRTIEFDPDVISLHNLHGGYFDTSLLVELSKVAPLVWTLHDMWAFTGNAAHTFGDESWKELKAGLGEHRRFPTIGLPTGTLLLKRKKQIYQNADLTIVTPSRWLKALAQQAPVFQSKRIVHIANGVDVRVFHPHRSEARAVLQIPSGAVVLMFAAEKLEKSEFKGGHDLVEILQHIHSHSLRTIHLLILGQGSIRELQDLEKFVVHQMGYVDNEQTVAHCFAAADLLIYPTKADTLPNALIESIASGTPAIAFDVGGCGEIIHNDYNGQLITSFDTRLFAERTIALINDADRLRNYAVEARSFAEHSFSLPSMARAYYSLFKEVIEKRKPV